MRLHPQTVFARTETLVDAARITPRRAFHNDIGAVVARFVKSGAYGGSACREAVLGACEKQLRERTDRALDTFFETHASMSAPPSETFRRAAKDWIATRITARPKTFSSTCHGGCASKRILVRVLTSKSEPVANEIVHSRVSDNEFDKLQRDRIERSLRLVARLGSYVSTIVRGK